ncbi:MAG: FMN-binding protein [Bacillota bacterium]
MRNILRLSLTLAIVGIVSAALLTGVYNWTEPIIAEREAAEYLQAVQEFFPTVADTRQETIENNLFDLIYDSSNNLLGVMAVIQQQGYDGIITYNLAMDSSGKIIGLRIISHSDTPGIGDVITTPGFQSQFIGKTYEDPIEKGVDVDSVSGATVSTSAMINSVRQMAGVIAFTFLSFEEEIFDITAVPDGTYEGIGRGLMDEIAVAVTVEGGQITAIKVLRQNETPNYYVESYPLIPERIIAEQSLEIDIKTGATGSAEGIVNAVRDALQKAIEGGGEESE